MTIPVAWAKLARVALTLAIVLVSCSSQPASTKHIAAPRATAVAPTNADLEAVVHRFYHAIRQAKFADAWELGSPNFQRNHLWTDFVGSFGPMGNPDEQIDDVHGRTVEYTLNYANIADDKVYKVLWRRHGTWTLVHGSQGWMLDAGSIEDDTIVGLIDDHGKRFTIDNDEAVSDSHHVFTLATTPYDSEYSYVRKPDGGWAVTFDRLVGVPAPVATTAPYTAQQPQPETTTAPYAPQTYAPYVPPAYTNCDDDTIETVADDGSTLIMQSGAVYSVDPADESTASAWVADDDVLICNDDKIINKDENGETVDVSPAQ